MSNDARSNTFRLSTSRGGVIFVFECRTSPCHSTPNFTPAMFRGRNKGIRGRGRSGVATKVPLKGLFADGIWQCNCDPRLSAQHFQTKNGGKNHGRWCRFAPVGRVKGERSQC